MELNIPERLYVLELLPKEGTYADVKEIRRAREIIALNNKDLKAVDFVPESQKYNLDKANTYIIDLPVSEWMTNTIRGILVKLEHDRKLPEGMVSIYEKFVIDHE
jgi:hypothetical protein